MTDKVDIENLIYTGALVLFTLLFLLFAWSLLDTEMKNQQELRIECIKNGGNVISKSQLSYDCIMNGEKK